MIKKLKMNVIHGEKLELSITADKNTIQRFRQAIKAIDHNITEEVEYKLSNTKTQESQP